MQRLVDDAAVVLARQAELGLDRGAEQRAAELVQVLALHHDAVRRALEGLDVGDRDAHVLEPQRLERLEAEDVADDRGGQVGDRARPRTGRGRRRCRRSTAPAVRHGIDAVGLGLVVFAAVSRSVHTTVQVAVDDSPATAAAASIGSTPSCGVMRNSARMSVSFGS